MIEAGKILQNRYRIEKQIGQGGMGTVFVAIDERFGSTVAIKETFFEEEKLSKAFEREARLLNSLKHPALPKVSDYFAEENGQFIVMEFITGEDLSEILEKSDQPFAVEEVLNWANQLCDALKYLHTQDMPVIHRDIKPQNLKLTPAGQIILLDFGLAKGNPNDASHKTQAKSIFGYSRNYASLEQIQGTGTDPQSDLYSLAATLYHLMSGIPPADALTRAMNVLNAKSDPLIPANLINKRIPKGVAQVLQQTMALNANERPVSAVEMRQMLESCDKTVDLSETEADAVFAPGLLTQKTKLMSRATNVNEAAESELKTEIFTTNDMQQQQKSTLTQVARPFTRIPARAGNGVLFGGAALSLLAIIAGFAYFSMNWAQNNTEPKAEKQTLQNQLVPSNTAVAAAETKPSAKSAVPENPNNPENAPPKEPAVDETAAVRDQTKTVPEPAKKSPDAPRTTVNNTKVIVSGAPEEFVFDTDEGKIKIIGERFETEEYILDQNGIKFKNPGKFPELGKLPLSPEHFKRMTPLQRQKLADAIEAQKRMREAKKAVPPPPKQPIVNPPANNSENQN